MIHKMTEVVERVFRNGQCGYLWGSMDFPLAEEEVRRQEASCQTLPNSLTAAYSVVKEHR